MAELTGPHWTNRSTEDFLIRIAADFVRQIELAMDAAGISRQELAARLNVSKGRVSQVLNNPGNISLKNIIEYSLASEQKPAIIAYNDTDPSNAFGPINAEVFTKSWELVGKPRDAFDLAALQSQTRTWFVIQPMIETGAGTGAFASPPLVQSHLPLGSGKPSPASAVNGTKTVAIPTH